MRHKIFNKGLLRNLDWLTLGIICALFAVGLITIINVTASPFIGEESTPAEIFEKLNLSSAIRQLLFFVAGMVILFVFTAIDYHAITPYIKYFYLIMLLSLVAVLFFGSRQRGTAGWFMIGSYGFQPAEFGKMVIILVLARSISKQTEAAGEFGITELRQIIPAIILVAIPVLLIMRQPDYGTAMVYVLIFLSIIFVGKTAPRVLMMLLIMAGILIPIVWFSMEDWQRLRIFTFLDPNYESTDAGLQVAQARIAIGSGQIFGKGLFAPGSLSQLGYIPEQHNDFIFSGAVETFGLVGGLVILSLYALLIIRTFQLAMRAKDDYGVFIIVGVGAMVLFHVIENVGMNIGLLPVTGIPLPLFSYGGSNLVTTLGCYGMVLSVDMRRGRWKTM